MGFLNVTVYTIKQEYLLSRDTIVYNCTLQIEKINKFALMNENLTHSWVESIKELPIYFTDSDPYEEVMILAQLRLRLFEFEIQHYDFDERTDFVGKLEEKTTKNIDTPAKGICN